MAIRHGTAPFIECSSKGDRRFSAFFARIAGYERHGQSIETLYQAAKIFDDGSTNKHWRDAKGKTPVNAAAVRILYAQLWDEYVSEHPEYIPDLVAASGLKDMFGQDGHVCSATELWRIRAAFLPDPESNATPK